MREAKSDVEVKNTFKSSGSALIYSPRTYLVDQDWLILEDSKWPRIFVPVLLGYQGDKGHEYSSPKGHFGLKSWKYYPYIMLLELKSQSPNHDVIMLFKCLW